MNRKTQQEYRKTLGKVLSDEFESEFFSEEVKLVSGYLLNNSSRHELMELYLSNIEYTADNIKFNEKFYHPELDYGIRDILETKILNLERDPKKFDENLDQLKYLRGIEVCFKVKEINNIEDLNITFATMLLSLAEKLYYEDGFAKDSVFKLNLATHFLVLADYLQSALVKNSSDKCIRVSKLAAYVYKILETILELKDNKSEKFKSEVAKTRKGIGLSSVRHQDFNKLKHYLRAQASNNLDYQKLPFKKPNGKVSYYNIAEDIFWQFMTEEQRELLPSYVEARNGATKKHGQSDRKSIEKYLGNPPNHKINFIKTVYEAIRQ